MNMKKSRTDRLLLILFISAGLFCLIYALISLRWKMAHDAPLYLYSGLLMDRFGMVPYIDFYTVNAPGTLLWHEFLYRVIGTSDFIFRLIDLWFLGLLTWSGWYYLRVWKNRTAAIAGPLLFAMTYLGTGHWHSMQREYFTLLPLVLSLIAAFRFTGWSLYLRALIIGFLFSLIISIKPVPGLAFPVVLMGMLCYDPALKGKHGRKALITAVSALGLIIGLSIPLIYLACRGALKDFTEMAVTYWPVYSKLDGTGQTHNVLAEYIRTLDVAGLFSNLQRYRFFGLLPIGLFCSYWVSKDNRQRQIEIMVLFGLIPVFLIALWTANKMWIYHHFPLFLILSYLSGFALFPLDKNRVFQDRMGRAILFVAILMIVTVLPVRSLGRQIRDFVQGKEMVVKNGDVREITAFLEANLKEEDRVVPLDVTGGAIHAMYRAGARIGSSFFCDWHFYHNCHLPYVQKLRSRMIQELTGNRSRFIIQFHEKWKPWGKRACPEFPELDRIILDMYEPIFKSTNYTIYEIRKSDASVLYEN